MASLKMNRGEVEQGRISKAERYQRQLMKAQLLRPGETLSRCNQSIN
jgi:hypothetical protein